MKMYTAKELEMIADKEVIKLLRDYYSDVLSDGDDSIYRKLEDYKTFMSLYISGISKGFDLFIHNQ